MKTPQIFDHHIRKNFSKAAKTFDAAAILHKEAGNRLLERLQLIKLTPATILDLGAGTGIFNAPLQTQYPAAKLIALDITAAMLLQAKKKLHWWQRNKPHFICANAVQIPLADNSVDLIFSNMMLHWVSDLPSLFKELHRVLKPQGLLFFSTLGVDTLKELKSSWGKIDDKVHVHNFTDMHDIGDYLQQAKFKDPVVDMEKITLEYTHLKALMADLKATGSNIHVNPGLTGKNMFNQLLNSYDTYRNTEGRLPATFEIIYGHAFGAELLPTPISTEVRIPVANIFKRK